MKHLIAIAMIALTGQAQAATCLPRPALVRALEDTHGERMTGGGLQNAAHLIEVWSSDKTGSFTVFITNSDGMACIVATGQNWHNSPTEITNPDTGSPG